MQRWGGGGRWYLLTVQTVEKQEVEVLRRASPAGGRKKKRRAEKTAETTSWEAGSLTRRDFPPTEMGWLFGGELNYGLQAGAAKLPFA